MVPVVRTIQKYWPDTELTWIIGKNEAALINDIEKIEFIEFDKLNFIKGYKHIINKLKNRKFDVLLSAQVSLRANIISTFVSATTKLGYDSNRSKDFHSLFINQCIPPTSKQHVLDSFFSFIEYLGLSKRALNWNYHVTDDAERFAQQYLAADKFKVIISPCSSHPIRNWSTERYAAVADYAIQSIDAQVILCGGPTKIEQQIGIDIENHMQHKALNLIGKDNLKKFLALLQHADVLISPDSGPAHIATGLGTPVIGLYAASNPKRSGPYLSQQWCVDKYDVAARKFRNKSASDLKWGTKLEYKGVMDLISVEDVTNKLEKLVQQYSS